MGMYPLIEAARAKALEAANSWHQTPDAKALLEKVDAYERLSDFWSVEVPEAAVAFNQAASEAADELDQLRGEVIDAAAATYSEDRLSDEWFDAWDAADSDAPPVKQVIQDARQFHMGDRLLKQAA